MLRPARTTSPAARRILAALVIAFAIASAQPAAWAKAPHADKREPARAGSRYAQGAVSLDAVVRQMEQRFNARVVRAETREEKGRTVYVLRLLSEDGKVWTVKVDADSGAVL
ncbi:MAG TPA: PepSY domain-containing protein [Steroidobacteraceae bacterium]|nr:PepSY domain-containing protein [Steroidobacteraceae bacterium]